MEYDLYNRNEVPDEQTIQEYLAPSTAKYYKTNGKLVGVEIIPIRNVILDDEVQIVLNKLKRSLLCSSYSPKTFNQKNLSGLDPNLKDLFTKYIKKICVPPIQVRTAIVINDPSPSDPSMPSVVGLGAPLISRYPGSTDYLYQIIDGVDRVALSLYFNYDHIPVIVQF